LPALFSGALSPTKEALANALFDNNSRRPIRQWLQNIDPRKTPSTAYWDGKPLTQPVQNGGSCASENLLAFLATTLPPSDYKLAKAACLNTMAQIAEKNFKDDRAMARDIARIKERAAHALAGSTLV
jgi:hypothetical protein